MSSTPITIMEIQAWFEDRGFRLELREEAGRYWADLASLATGKVLAPRYGGGDTDIDAANRAKARYEQEQ